MVFSSLSFEWTSTKEAENIAKHRITFHKAVESFHDPSGILLRDEKHSKDEERFYWVGKSQKGRILTTRFTYRGQTIRIFGSAEWRQFRKLYETTKA